MLKEIREEKGLSQGNLAKASGINVQWISKVERGVIKTENISLGNAIKIAKALGCRPEDLL